MARPSKPVKVLQMEAKSHRTKREIAQRAKGEDAALSKKRMTESPEVRANEEAHKEFIRIRKLFDAIEKNDDLYSAVINRYCLLKAEVKELVAIKDMRIRQLEQLEESRHEMDPDVYIKLANDISRQIIRYDNQIQQKRKMRFDIEKENIMTVAAALRSVPKQPEKKTNSLLEALNG